MVPVGVIQHIRFTWPYPFVPPPNGSTGQAYSCGRFKANPITWFDSNGLASRRFIFLENMPHEMPWQVIRHGALEASFIKFWRPTPLISSTVCAIRKIDMASGHIRQSCPNSGNQADRNVEIMNIGKRVGTRVGSDPILVVPQIRHVGQIRM